MGLAKNKLFGKPSSRWPRLQQLVDQGILLEIDLAYAETQVKQGTEEEAALHAALIALARAGHLALEKEKVDELSPLLGSMIKQRAQLPKFAQIDRPQITRNSM